jgi:hypothetical protein
MIGLATVALAACGYPAPASTGGPAAAVSTTTPTPSGGALDNFNDGGGRTPVKFPDGLRFIDLKTGTGETVRKGATVQAQYTGWLSDGTVFDSSRPRGSALCVILNASAQSSGNCTSVIPGWIEGIPGMKVGGRRKLIIPPALAYGSQGASPQIPPNATLTFTVEIVAITAEPSPAPSGSPSASPSSAATPTATP